LFAPEKNHKKSQSSRIFCLHFSAKEGYNLFVCENYNLSVRNSYLACLRRLKTLF
jgi:hypothetical protein